LYQQEKNDFQEKHLIYKIVLMGLIQLKMGLVTVLFVQVDMNVQKLLLLNALPELMLFKDQI